MLAAENGALPQGKVGGMGDVTRDLPRAIAAAGHDVTVMTPAYGMYSGLTGAGQSDRFAVPFAGATEHVSRYTLPRDEHGIVHEVLDHPRFAPHGRGQIYCDDGADSPFHTDATKFAFFSAAAAMVARKETPDIVHLHDWHLGFYCALRRFDRRYSPLRRIRTVFTIHNLALQGIRPFAGTDSSWIAWFPWLNTLRPELSDPRFANCVNPMAMGIRLADRVNTVSPGYAAEILEANDPAHGLHGGEGLEADLVLAHKAGKLVGILNGCEYPPGKRVRPSWMQLIRTAAESLRDWIPSERALRSAHYLAEQRIAGLPKRKPARLLTNIGRLTQQKSSLFQEPVAAGNSALDSLLERLGSGSLFIMLGAGDPQYERFFTEVAVRHENFLFLNGFADALADMIYARGDLFLMPSSFEPCGISQMLAMRAAQPCVVHAVGGLKDTVTKRNGFPFSGETPRDQASAFVAMTLSALELRRSDPGKWKRLQDAVAAERFDWRASARDYLRRVYGITRR